MEIRITYLKGWSMILSSYNSNSQKSADYENKEILFICCGWICNFSDVTKLITQVPKSFVDSAIESRKTKYVQFCRIETMTLKTSISILFSLSFSLNNIILTELKHGWFKSLEQLNTTYPNKIHLSSEMKYLVIVQLSNLRS